MKYVQLKNKWMKKKSNQTISHKINCIYIKEKKQNKKSNQIMCNGMIISNIVQLHFWGGLMKK